MGTYADGVAFAENPSKLEADIEAEDISLKKKIAQEVSSPFLEESEGNKLRYGSENEIRGLDGVTNERSHKPLTLFRIVRCLIFLFILVSTAFTMLVFLAPPVYLFVGLFSTHHSRDLIAFFFGRWLSMWPFLFEIINGTKVIFAGDRVPMQERVMVICNHRTEVDWMYIWCLALRKLRIGYVKYVVKSSVRNAPVFGWAFHVIEFLLIDRKWEIDEVSIKAYLSTFQDRRDPIWLILFPEGTDFTEAKLVKSNSFAEKKGLPKHNYVLMPRTRGFYACLSELRQSLDSVYDLTIAYKYRCPLFVHNLLGTDPAEVHIHVRRVPVAEIPSSEDEASKWLYKVFAQKDNMLENFSKVGCFPKSGVEQDLHILKCTINFLIIVVTSVMLLGALFLHVWLRWYAIVSVTYLVSATYFAWRPLPFFGHSKLKKS